MSTVISTKTSGVGGLTVTGDASGVLQLASANGTTAVTIDASQNVTFAGSVNTPNTFGFKNLLIDAGFTINQRGYVSAATLATTVYAHDRWKAGASGGDYSFTQNASSTTITIASGKSLIQVVEDKNVNGTSFVLSWTGTAQARYAVNSATPAGAYAASPILITGQTQGATMSVEFNTGTLTTPQLEKGSVATSFDYRPYGTELSLCQRYYEQWSSIGASGSTYVNFLWGAMNVTTQGSFSANYIVPKRAIPTIGYSALADLCILYNGTSNAAVITSFSTFTSTQLMVGLQCSIGSAITAYQVAALGSNSNATTSKITFSAEL